MPSVDDQARLAAVGKAMLLDRPQEPIFDELTRAAARSLRTPFAFLTVVDDTRSFWMSRYGVSDDVRQNSVGDSFCQYVIESNRELVLGDVTAEPLTCDNPSVESMGVRAWAGYPVMFEGQVLGTFCVIDQTIREWSETDRDILSNLAGLASREIALRAALIEAEARRDDAERYAERSRELLDVLRTSLLPPVLPHIPGCAVEAHFEVAAGGDTMLGDFYDVFPLDATRWGVALGDVCGHGVEAAKLTALVRYSLRSAAIHHRDPADVLRELDRAVHRDGVEPGRFATVCYLAVDVSSGVDIQIGRAGHPYPILVDAGGSARYAAAEAGGPPVGILTGGAEYTTDRITLSPDETLVLYSDGATEVRTDGSEHGRLGEAGLLEMVAAAHRTRPSGLVASLLDGLRAGSTEFSDDVVLLTLRRH